MKKKIFVCAALFVSLVVGNSVSASESDYIEFPLESIEEIVITYQEGNNEYTIQVQKNALSSRIGKGTYKISKSLKGSWSLSFNVGINDKEKFTKADNLSLKAIVGSISSSSLTSTSNSATCSFSQKIGVQNSNAKVVASISNGKLVVK